MKYIDFENKKLSKIILGGDYYGDLVTETDVYKLIDCYVSTGGNFFDTARLYTGGKSETIYGKWLKNNKRDDFFVATKGGCREINGVKYMGISQKEIETDLDNSLKAFDMAYVDLYYLHRDDENIPVEEIIEYLNSFVKKGKIKNIGVSNWKSERIKKANEYAKENNLVPITFSQIKYSLAKTSPYYVDDSTLVEMNDKEYEFYKGNNIIVAAFAPQAKGFFSKMEKAGAEGLDAKTRERYYCEENCEKYNRVSEIAEKYKISVGSVSVNYLTSKDIDVLPIVGCKNVNQLMDSLNGCDITFSQKEMNFLDNKE